MTIHFPDYSHYQDGHSLAGAPALIAKGTEGTGFTDPSYRDFKARAARAGIPFMGYHWVNTTDLAAQAAHAFSVMPDVPVMWDAEAAGVTVPRLLDITKRFRALGGSPQAVYLPKWYWRDHMGSPDLRPLEAAGLYLISSNYPASGYSENGPGWLPYGGVTPKQWQYTSTPVDMNAFKGTVDDLRRLWGLEDDMPTAAEIAVAVWAASWNGPAGRESAADRLAMAARGTAAVAALVPKLNEILAAALDDGDTTVVLPPEAIAELQEISAAIAAVPTAAENAEAVADELHERTTD